MDETEAGLTRRDVEILEFERSWWKHVGVKEKAIKERFGLPVTRYYEVVDGLLESPAAVGYDPILIKRLRRLRSYRQRQRGARHLRVEYEPVKR